MQKFLIDANRKVTIKGVLNYLKIEWFIMKKNQKGRDKKGVG